MNANVILRTLLVSAARGLKGAERVSNLQLQVAWNTGKKPNVESAFRNAVKAFEFSQSKGSDNWCFERRILAWTNTDLAKQLPSELLEAITEQVRTYAKE